MTTAGIMWLCFLTCLPFAWFLFPWLDVWKAQAYLAHLSLIALMGILVAFGGKGLPRNAPVACWAGYCVVLSLILFNVGVKQWGTYTVEMALPLLHVLSVLLFYLCAMTQWDRALLQQLLRWVGVSGALILAYCLLQLLHFDQFYIKRDLGIHSFIGVIGNVSLCSAHLSMLFPVFLYLAQSWSRWWAVAVGVALFLIAHLAVVNRSASGVLGVVAVLTVWGLLQERVLLVWAGLAVVGLLAYAMTHHALLSFSGRFEAWAEYLTYVRKASITGHGLGAVRTLSLRAVPGPIFGWAHVHNEFLQVWLEQGAIGLSLMGWTVMDWAHKAWRLRGDTLVTCLASVGAAFLVNALIGFPMHLWVLGALGLLGYCGIQVLWRERLA